MFNFGKCQHFETIKFKYSIEFLKNSNNAFSHRLNVSNVLSYRFFFSVEQFEASIQAPNAIKRAAVPIVVSALISTVVNVMPANADFSIAPWSDKIQYEVVKSNPNGEKPKVGEMVAVRFKGSYKGTTFDDTFSTEQPYYYRAGVGLIVKGLDDTIVNMHV